MRTQFRLQIPPRLLRRYQERYNVNADPKLDHLRDVSRHPGYLTVNQLYELCQWKSHRRPALARTNSAEFVREITAFAFKTPSEEARIAALTLLAGVSYPTASVILHFCVDDSYPILDWRALESLGFQKPPPYTPAFWLKYTAFCRALSSRHGLTVRQLDMALWQYSKDRKDG